MQLLYVPLQILMIHQDQLYLMIQLVHRRLVMRQNSESPPLNVLHRFFHIKWLIMFRSNQLKWPINLPLPHVRKLLLLKAQRNQELIVSWLHFLQIRAQCQRYQMVHQCSTGLINNILLLRSPHPSFPQVLLPHLCLLFCLHPWSQCYLPQNPHKRYPPQSRPHYLQTLPP